MQARAEILWDLWPNTAQVALAMGVPEVLVLQRFRRLGREHEEGLDESPYETWLKTGKVSS